MINMTAINDPSLKVTQTALDIIEHAKKSRRYRAFKPKGWDWVHEKRKRNSVVTNQFPPDDISGADNANHIIQRLLNSWENYNRKPDAFADLSPTAAVAKMIDLPRLDEHVIDRLAYDPEAKIAAPLARKMDHYFGLEGVLEKHAVVPNKKDKYIINLPFQMEPHRYIWKKHSHAQLFDDIFTAHEIDAKDLSMYLKTSGLKAKVIDEIAQSQIASSDDQPEQILSRELSRQIDRKIFGLRENGPFVNYYDARIIQQDKSPVVVRHGTVLPERSYSDIYPLYTKPPIHTAKEQSLIKKRQQFYHNLADLTEQKIKSPLDLMQHYGVSLITSLGLAKPPRKDRKIIKDHPELVKAGINEMTEIVAPQTFLSPERRKDMFTLSDLYKANWIFADQPKRSWEIFVKTAEQNISQVSELVQQDENVNITKELCTAIYPTTQLNDKYQTDDKNGSPKLYVMPTLYDSWVKNGVLVKKPKKPLVYKKKTLTP